MFSLWIIYTSRYQTLFVPVSFASSHWVYLLESTTYVVRNVVFSKFAEQLDRFPWKWSDSHLAIWNLRRGWIHPDTSNPSASTRESGCQASGDRGFPMNLHLLLASWGGGRSKLYKNWGKRHGMKNFLKERTFKFHPFWLKKFGGLGSVETQENLTRIKHNKTPSFIGRIPGFQSKPKPILDDNYQTISHTNKKFEGPSPEICDVIDFACTSCTF